VRFVFGQDELAYLGYRLHEAECEREHASSRALEILMTQGWVTPYIIKGYRSPFTPTKTLQQ
jgi:hypothetical protein